MHLGWYALQGSIPGLGMGLGAGSASNSLGLGLSSIGGSGGGRSGRANPPSADTHYYHNDA
jgi:hypothetical protein